MRPVELVLGDLKSQLSDHQRIVKLIQGNINLLYKITAIQAVDIKIILL